jgi:hypothetical protein
MKHVGCVCDLGYRGPDCSLEECPSGPDVLLGDGESSEEISWDIAHLIPYQVTRKAATALVVASVITRAVSASASLDTSVPSASTRLFLVKKKEHDAFSHFLDSDIKDAGKAKVGNVENLLRDKSNRTRMMSRSPKYTHQPPQLL